MAREFTYEEATAPQSVLGLADQVGVPITNTTIARDVMPFPVDVVAKISRSGEQCGCSCEGWSESEHESDTGWPMCACTACGPVGAFGRRLGCRNRVMPQRGWMEAAVRGCRPQDGSSADDFPGNCSDCREHVALMMRRWAILRAREKRERSRSQKRKSCSE